MNHLMILIEEKERSAWTAARPSDTETATFSGHQAWCIVMVKAYLRYELVSTFGVVASAGSLIGRAAVVGHHHALESGKAKGNTSARRQCVVTPAVDALLVWDIKTTSLIVRLANEATARAGSVTAIAVAPSGRDVAAGYADGSIRIWPLDVLESESRADMHTSALGMDSAPPRMTLNAHYAGISALAWDQASGVLASGANDGDIIVWDVVAECGMFRLRAAHSDAVTALSFCNSGSEGQNLLISSSKDGVMRVFDTRSQFCVQTIVGHRGEIWAHCIVANGAFLVSGSINSELRVYKMERRDTNGLDGLSAQGELLKFIGLVRRRSSARVVDMDVMERTHASGNDASYVGTLVVVGGDRSVECFSIRDVLAAEAHRKRRARRAKERAKRKLTEKPGSSASKRLLLDEEVDEEEKGDKMVAGTYTPDDTENTIAIDVLAAIRLVRLKSRVHAISVLDIRSSRGSSSSPGLTSSRLLIHCHSNGLEIIDLPLVPLAETGLFENMEKRGSFDSMGHRGDVRALAMSHDESFLVTASAAKTLKVWSLSELSRGQCLRSMTTDGHALGCLFVPDRRSLVIVATKEGALQVLRTGSGESVCSIPQAHTGAIWSIVWHPKQAQHLSGSYTLISGGADKKIRFWRFHADRAEKHVAGDDDESSKGLLELERTAELTDEVLCVRCSPDGKMLLASLLDSTVRAFYADTLAPFVSFYGHKLPVLSMDISSDGEMLVTGSADKTIKIWGMHFGDLRKSLARAHDDSVLNVRLQAGTHYFFSGSRDGRLKYWDGDRFELICDLTRHHGECWAISTSADGEVVASVSSDRAIRVWRRSDEQMFLEDEREQRLDEMFERDLLTDPALGALDDDDNGRANRHSLIMYEPDAGTQQAVGQSSVAVKRTLESVRGSEALMEALELAAKEQERKEEEQGVNPSMYKPSMLLLGLQPDQYVLRSLRRIKVAEVESALMLLSYSQARSLLEYCVGFLRDPATAILHGEMVVRMAIILVRNYQNQIIASGERELLQQLAFLVRKCTNELKQLLGCNMAALDVWGQDLAERDQAPFREAIKRVNVEHRLAIKKKSKKRRIGSKGI
ncbi:U3 small nucleolar RNA-associated protein 12 [Porphyridium purpureum]|uniref:U3 small nucleolar RNA-associated protein 12 n=1 Tax=Porphyridium purpureum TaxID=35688 RepID=A0A5J4Z2Y1_PORPP|nr:U3 small nucleolar RNA-associated protein 12 [Porphyridium purpureum]|eukprot:POR3667..scf208_2